VTTPTDAHVNLGAYLDARRRLVDDALSRWSPAPPDSPAVIADAMRYSLMGGGKRLRPLLVIASAEAVVADPSTVMPLALPAACAVEMIHTYSLIHDDLPAMDDDSMRRGRATSHVVYGDGMAILAGDGLQAEAFALLAREPRLDDPPIAARKLAALQLVAEAAGAAGMVGGQALDLAADPRHRRDERPPLPFDRESLADMHARKTGALIRASVLAGAVMGGATPDPLAALDRYAREIGLAFQIVDDILDVEGASAELGKTAGKDAAHGKPTYPGLFGLAESRRLAAECLRRAESALADGGLAHSALGPIARWVVDRRR
jgi:geranylgeranyl diphosphate synthase type II